jgi:hypothetical protein
MAKDDSMASAIESCRKVSDDGKLVTYDLTNNIDFSKPKKVAEALTEVFSGKMLPDGSRFLTRMLISHRISRSGLFLLRSTASS